MDGVFLTARLWLIALLGAGAAAGAAALLSPAILPVAVGGWAALCAVAAGIDVALAPNPKRVGITRRAPAQAVRDEPVQVLIEMQNFAPRAIRGTVTDDWPVHAAARPSDHQRAQIARAGGSSSKRVPFEAAPGEQVRIGLTLAPKRRGALRSNYVIVRSRGPLGLAGRSAWHEVPGEIAVAWSPRGILRSIAFSQQQRQQPDQNLAASLLADIDDRNADIVLREFEELRLLAAHYGGLRSPGLDPSIPFADRIRNRLPGSGEGSAPDRSGRLLPLIEHLSDLFARARQRVEEPAGEQQQRLLLSRYADTLGKLTDLLSETYYGDILRNPHYWSEPEQRIEQVMRAIDAVDDEVVENIRQLSESRDIEFQVKVESLIRPRNGAKLSDVYPDRRP